MSDGTPETITPADREAERLKAAYQDGCEDTRRRIEGKHRVSSPASVGNIIPNSDRIAELEGQLLAAQRQGFRAVSALAIRDPLKACLLRLEDLRALSSQLCRRVEAAEADVEADLSMTAIELSKLLVAINALAGGLENCDEAFTKAGLPELRPTYPGKEHAES
jgi:hypothetical protein